MDVTEPRAWTDFCRFPRCVSRELIRSGAAGAWTGVWIPGTTGNVGVWSHIGHWLHSFDVSFFISLGSGNEVLEIQPRHLMLLPHLRRLRRSACIVPLRQMCSLHAPLCSFDWSTVLFFQGSTSQGSGQQFDQDTHWGLEKD